ncbi:hypothetical protein [Paenibacillus odorifer]|uniref:Uncharacterized protein n=1 Tax=Paenibacillus odorifer TaxID=189426 RepID=A0A1R0Y171_9BACL|nr:hypothetical protein [Paenibacillus odorifer]OMD41068.1 hypothetical protein BSK52_11575 [Paenibacillus odorifer]
MKETMEKFKGFWADEKGEVGIKQIAMTVGVIILIGVVVTSLSSGSTLADWVGDVWDAVFGKIKDVFDLPES